MPLVEAWLKTWIYLGCVCGWTRGVRPQFDTSTDMGLVLVPADAEVGSVIFRLRATDQDADFPLVFDVTAAATPIVRIENLPCTLYNKVCQANVILTRQLISGRLHDFAVRVRDSKGESNSMQATISVTNASTPRDTIFPHIPSLIMVPEDTKPGKELDYLLARASPWSGKPVYIELWQPKELFTIRQRQTPAQTRGIITLIGELDFETQSMYTLKMYATDPYTEPGKDTRNIAGLHVVVVVQDVQDVPPVFTLAPPLTRLNNSVQPGDVILRVHAEDGDKGAPREITYGLVSEGNPFVPFFNISETTGEITLARPLEELIQITHVGAPVVLSVVAEEIRRSREEPPAQATIVELGLLLGEPGNSPPFFENEKYMAWMEENADPGTVVTFTAPYSTKVRDEDVGKAGFFALKLGNNNGTFEVAPAVAERTANFIITVRDNSLIDYETHKTLEFTIIAQEVGPATNLSASVPVTIFLRDVNDNPPEFEQEMYEVTLSENVTAGTRVTQVHATDKDTGLFGSIQYTRILGSGSEALVIDPDTGIITTAMGTTAWLDREAAPSLQLSVEARDEDGRGLRSTAPLIINILDVNDNEPIFEQEFYEFSLNSDLTNFTTTAIIKAVDADAEPPNNEVRYELIHGNYENKFYLNEITGELIIREPINKARRTRHSAYQHFAAKFKKGFLQVQDTFQKMMAPTDDPVSIKSKLTINSKDRTRRQVEKIWKNRKKRAEEDALYTLTVRAYDLGVPHRSSMTQVRVISGAAAEARTVMFVVSGEHPDKMLTAKTLEAITGGRITIQEIRPYAQLNQSNGSGSPGVQQPGGEEGKKSIVVARVEQRGPGTSLVDIESIREILAKSGVGIIADMDVPNTTRTISGSQINTSTGVEGNANAGANTNTNTNVVNETFTSVHHEEVTVYRAENKLLLWLLILLGLLAALAALASILCCICPGCPFYMAPRKRRVHSSETLIVHSDGRPKRHLHRKQTKAIQATMSGKKQAWSADPTKTNWQFNRRNTRNRGLTSLPGDIAYIQSQEVPVPPLKITSLRLRDGPAPIYIRDPALRHKEERIYIEDVEGQTGRGYDLMDVDSIRKHEMERGSDIPRQSYIYVDQHPTEDTLKFRREQHFYRDGNAEVLRLVTRGHFDGEEAVHQVQRPTTLVIGEPHGYRPDGKDILLQRFIEDQKLRYNQNIRDSMQDLPVDGMESFQRPKESLMQQSEIILLPERLEREHRRHLEELAPDVQRLVIDHGDSDKDHKVNFEVATARETERQYENDVALATGAAMVVGEGTSKVVDNQPRTGKDHAGQPFNITSYTVHEMELARQNVLLTQLLLERESRGVGGALDSSSFLETQSLPGQVAIATQTDRTAATQTEQIRSRSDNDESEDDARLKKKLKLKKRYGDNDFRRNRSLWMRSPIQEEDKSFSGQRTSVLRRKAKESRDGRRATLETEVLREISDSLDDYGSSPKDDKDRMVEAHRYASDVTDREDKVQAGKENLEHGSIESSTSPEMIRDKYLKRSHSVEQEMAKEQELLAKSNKDKQASPERQSFQVIEKKISLLRRQANKLKMKKLQGNGEKVQEDTTMATHEVQDVHSRSEIENGSKKVRIDRNTSEEKIDKRTSGSKSVSALGSSKSISSADMDKFHEGGEKSMLKTRRMLKFQKSKKISTESSEIEESFENMKQENSENERELLKKKQLSSTSSDNKSVIESKNKRTELKKKSTSTQQQGNDKHKGESKSSSIQLHGHEISEKIPPGKPLKSRTGRTDGKRESATSSQSFDEKSTEGPAGKSSKAKFGRTIFSKGRIPTKQHSHTKSTDESTSETPKPHSEREKMKKTSSTQKHKIVKTRDNILESMESDSHKSDHKGKIVPVLQQYTDDKEKKSSERKSSEAKSEHTKSRGGVSAQWHLKEKIAEDVILMASKVHPDYSKGSSLAQRETHHEKGKEHREKEETNSNVNEEAPSKSTQAQQNFDEMGRKDSAEEQSEAKSELIKSTEDSRVEKLPAPRSLEERIAEDVILMASKLHPDHSKGSSSAHHETHEKRREDGEREKEKEGETNSNVNLEAPSESIQAHQKYEEKGTKDFTRMGELPAQHYLEERITEDVILMASKLHPDHSKGSSSAHHETRHEEKKEDGKSGKVRKEKMHSDAHLEAPGNSMQAHQKYEEKGTKDSAEEQSRVKSELLKSTEDTRVEKLPAPRNLEERIAEDVILMASKLHPDHSKGSSSAHHETHEKREEDKEIEKEKEEKTNSNAHLEAPDESMQAHQKYDEMGTKDSAEEQSRVKSELLKSTEDTRVEKLPALRNLEERIAEDVILMASKLHPDHSKGSSSAHHETHEKREEDTEREKKKEEETNSNAHLEAPDESMQAHQKYEEKGTKDSAEEQTEAKSEPAKLTEDTQPTQQLSNRKVDEDSIHEIHKLKSNSAEVEDSTLSPQFTAQGSTQDSLKPNAVHPESREQSMSTKEQSEVEDKSHPSKESLETNVDHVEDEEKHFSSHQYSGEKDTKFPVEGSVETTSGQIDFPDRSAPTQRLLDTKSAEDSERETLKSSSDHPGQKLGGSSTQQDGKQGRQAFLGKSSELDAAHSQATNNIFSEIQHHGPFSAEAMKNFLTYEINESLQNLQGSHPTVDETSRHRKIEQSQQKDVHDKKKGDGNIPDAHKSDTLRVTQKDKDNSHDQSSQPEFSAERDNQHKSESTSEPPVSSQIMQQNRTKESKDHDSQLDSNVTSKLQIMNKLLVATFELAEEDGHKISGNESDSVQNETDVRSKDDDRQQDLDLTEQRRSSEHKPSILKAQALHDSQQEPIISLDDETKISDDGEKEVKQSRGVTGTEADNSKQAELEKETIDDHFRKTDSPPFYVLSEESSECPGASDKELPKNRSSPTLIASGSVPSRAESHVKQQNSAGEQSNRSPEKLRDKSSIDKSTAQGTAVSPSFRVLDSKFPTNEQTPGMDSIRKATSRTHIPATIIHSIVDFHPREVQYAEGDSKDTVQNKKKLTEPAQRDEPLMSTAKVDEGKKPEHLRTEESSSLQQTENKELQSPSTFQTTEGPAKSNLEVIHIPRVIKSAGDFISETTLKTEPYRTPRHQPRLKSPERNVDGEEKDDVKSLDRVFGSVQHLDEATNIESNEHSTSEPLSRKEHKPKGIRNPSYEEAMKSKIVEGGFGSDGKTDEIQLMDGKKNVRSIGKLRDDSKRKRTDQETSSVTIPDKHDQDDNAQKERIAPKIQVLISPSYSKTSPAEQKNDKVISRDTEKQESPGDNSGKPRVTQQHESKDSSKKVEKSGRPKEKKVAVTPIVQVPQSRSRDSKRLHKPGDEEVELVEKKDVSEKLKGSKKKEEQPDKSNQQIKPLMEQSREPSSSGSGSKSMTPPKTDNERVKETKSGKGKSRYMVWYKQKRDEMDRKRQEKKDSEEEEQRPRWMRKRWKLRTPESVKDSKTPEVTPRTKRKVKPLVNVESEQLRAIVRQGRKLRREGGGGDEDPPVEIFAPEKPPTPPPPPDPHYHPLVQHSEYKYEKIPPPFYLHPPPGPHPSPQISPEHMQTHPDGRRPDDDLDSGIAVSLQGGTRLRHQQLLEKKSVFDIAYNEAAPYQLRADSTTPPS